jgi:hypothetical protein
MRRRKGLDLIIICHFFNIKVLQFKHEHDMLMSDSTNCNRSIFDVPIPVGLDMCIFDRKAANMFAIGHSRMRPLRILDIDMFIDRT